MLRSIAVIVWAIQTANPSVPDASAKAYAKIIQTESRKRNIDPFTIIAIVRNESGWRAGVVSRDGEDYGLGQIRARYIGACRSDRNSSACAGVKASLLSGAYNLRMVAASITQWRETCRRLTKRQALFHRWLHGYGGMGNLKRGIICGQTKTRKGWRDLPIRKALRKIMNYRKQLIRKLASKRKRKRKRRT